jgi:hypothetical protein
MLTNRIHAQSSTAAKFIHHRHATTKFVILSTARSSAAGSRYAKDLCILLTPPAILHTANAAARCKLDSVMLRFGDTTIPFVHRSGTANCIGPSRKKRAQDDKA